jgi:hypothetical protein
VRGLTDAGDEAELCKWGHGTGFLSVRGEAGETVPLHSHVTEAGHGAPGVVAGGRRRSSFALGLP